MGIKWISNRKKNPTNKRQEQIQRNDLQLDQLQKLRQLEILTFKKLSNLSDVSCFKIHKMQKKKKMENDMLSAFQYCLAEIRQQKKNDIIRKMYLEEFFFFLHFRD